MRRHIFTTVEERMHAHSGRGGFAVTARHADAVRKAAHDLRQEFHAADERDRFARGGQKFRQLSARSPN